MRDLGSGTIPGDVVAPVNSLLGSGLGVGQAEELSRPRAPLLR